MQTSTHTQKEKKPTKLYYPIATWQQKKKTEKRVDDINIFFLKHAVGRP